MELVKIIVTILCILVILGTGGLYHNSQVTALSVENEELRAQNLELAEQSTALNEELDQAQTTLEDAETLLNSYFKLEEDISNAWAEVQERGAAWAKSGFATSKFQPYIDSIHTLKDLDQDMVTLLEDNKEELEKLSLDVESEIDFMKKAVENWEDALQELNV